jgi:hypothetical protein
MSGHAAPAPLTPIAPVPGDEYVAGACNIGPWEIRRRRRSALVGFAAAAALFVLLVVVAAPAWARLVVLLPLWGGFVSWLQARRRFCVAFALAGVANFGDDDAARHAIADPAQRDADRRATVALLRDAFLLALGPAILAVIVPV